MNFAQGATREALARLDAETERHEGLESFLAGRSNAHVRLLDRATVLLAAAAADVTSQWLRGKILGVLHESLIVRTRAQHLIELVEAPEPLSRVEPKGCVTETRQ